MKIRAELREENIWVETERGVYRVSMGPDGLDVEKIIRVDLSRAPGLQTVLRKLTIATNGQ